MQQFVRASAAAIICALALLQDSSAQSIAVPLGTFGPTASNGWGVANCGAPDLAVQVQAPPHCSIIRFDFSSWGLTSLSATDMTFGDDCANVDSLWICCPGNIISTDSHPIYDLDITSQPGPATELLTVNTWAIGGSDPVVISAASELDCNANDIEDWAEINSAASLDTNGNLILDACEGNGPVWLRDPETARLLSFLPPMTYQEARLAASALGAKIATLNRIELCALTLGAPAQHLWLGLSDEASEGSFQWESGAPLGFTNWGPGAPGSITSDQDYVAINTVTGTWDTWFATTIFPAVIEHESPDCNGNLIPDQEDIANYPALDCDFDGVLDSCQGLDPALDCDQNGAIDSCEIGLHPVLDCNSNGLLDSCEISGDPSLDCNGDGVLDACQAGDPAFDCDLNGIVDICEIDQFPILDCDGNGVLDSCEGLPGIDCDGNGLIDSCEMTVNPDLDCNANGILDLCENLSPDEDVNGDNLLDSCFTPNYCTGASNSSGSGGTMQILGTPEMALDDCTLHATGLPALQWSYFIMSQSQGYVPDFGGSQGILCVGAPIVRFNITAGPGQQIDQTTLSGERSYTLDFANLPQGITFQPGDTWHFQLWFRDQNPGQTSNTTDGISVMFR